MNSCGSHSLLRGRWAEGLRAERADIGNERLGMERHRQPEGSCSRQGPPPSDHPATACSPTRYCCRQTAWPGSLGTWSAAPHTGQRRWRGREGGEGEVCGWMYGVGRGACQQAATGVQEGTRAAARQGQPGKAAPGRYPKPTSLGGSPACGRAIGKLGRRSSVMAVWAAAMRLHQGSLERDGGAGRGGGVEAA